jgi:hypothetical protein
MSTGDRGRDRLCLGAPLAQSRDEGGAVLFVSEALPCHRAEHRVGAELQVGTGALLAQGLDRIGEAHRLAHVAHPVGGVGGPLWTEQLTGEVGDDRYLGLSIREALGDFSELLEHRLHQWRVEGVGDGEALGLSSPLLPLVADSFDRLLFAGDDDRGGAVDRRDRELCLSALDRLGDLGLGCLDRRHRPSGG